MLVSLAWPNHVHHRRARSWFGAEARDGWATTPITEIGFIRVSAAVSPSVSPGQARDQLARMRGQGRHSFLVDDVELGIGDDAELADLTITRTMVTDAHLLALARRHRSRLATLDVGIQRLAGSRSRDVCLIPAETR